MHRGCRLGAGCVQGGCGVHAGCMQGGDQGEVCRAGAGCVQGGYGHQFRVVPIPAPDQNRVFFERRTTGRRCSEDSWSPGQRCHCIPSSKHQYPAPPIPPPPPIALPVRVRLPLMRAPFPTPGPPSFEVRYGPSPHPPRGYEACTGGMQVAWRRGRGVRACAGKQGVHHGCRGRGGVSGFIGAQRVPAGTLPTCSARKSARGQRACSPSGPEGDA